MAVVFFAAGFALGAPAARGHDGFAFVAGNGLAADAATGGFPDWAMAGFLAGEGVGDFVEEGFADLRFVIVGNEVVGEFDAFLAVAAEAEGALAAVPAEVPIGELEVGEELVGEGLGFGKVHPGAL